MKTLFKRFFLPMFMLSLIFLTVNGQVKQLTTTPGQAELPFIKIMKDGNIMVVYEEGHHFNMDGQMYYRILNTATGNWSPEWVKATQRVSSSAYAQLAEDNDGNLHMTYHDGNASANRDVYYAMFDFAQYDWKPKKLAYISQGTNSSWPRIQVDRERDKVLIVWSHNYLDSVGEMDLTMIENPFDAPWPVDGKKRMTISDTTWSVSIHGDFAYSNNKVYCIWMDDEHRPSNWSIYYNEGTFNENTQTWSFGTTERLFPQDVNQYYPALTLDDNDNPHILFSYKNNPVFYSRKVGDNWTPPKAISTSGTDQNMFAVMVHKAGLLHAVWRQAQNVVYARGLADGTWTTPIKLADGQFPGYPGIDVDDAGDAHVVWSDGDPDHPRQIYYTKVELPGEAPTAILKANKTNGLVPLTVNFDSAASNDTDGTIQDYRWSFGDGSSAEGKKVSHIYTKAGTFKATLTVIDNDLRSGTDSIDIIAHTGEPFASFEVSSNSGMRPVTVAFDASASEDFDGQIVSYTWEFGDGAVDSGVNVTHEYENGGDFAAKLTVTDNEGKTGTATEIIEVFQPPVAIFTADPKVGVPPLEVSFDASDSYDEDGTIKTYKWDYGDGVTALSKKEVHTFSTPGIFTVVLQVVDNDNYTGTSQAVIKVLNRPLPPIDIDSETMANRTAFYTDYVNKVTWEANPENSSLFTISNHRIYRKTAGQDDSQYTRVSEVSGTTFEYMDSGLGGLDPAQNYVYTVTCVDSQGNESLFPSQIASPRPIRNAARAIERIKK